MLDETGFEEVKVKFYWMMITYYLHERDTYQAATSFYKVRYESCIRLFYIMRILMKILYLMGVIMMLLVTLASGVEACLFVLLL